MICCFFFFNDTATTEIYTLSLHDALPIYECLAGRRPFESRNHVAIAEAHLNSDPPPLPADVPRPVQNLILGRSEEHTSELQSRQYLVCRLLLEKKKTQTHTFLNSTHTNVW